MAIYLSLLIAIILGVLPLPSWATYFRPEWVALTLIYWVMALPKTVNLGTAWIMGMLLDVLTGSLLGQHALALLLICYIAIKLHQQIRVFPLLQQSSIIAALVALYLGILLWMDGLRGRAPDSWLYWAPVLTSFILWPWIFVFLREIRRAYVTGRKS
jgi:rod shape-determining protein MreD